MAERFNYTGRQTIEPSTVHVRLMEQGDRRWFTASVDFDQYDLSSSARVFIEAYIKNHLLRFDFGTVGAFAAPKDTSLNEFGDEVADVLYRVKVVADDVRRSILAMPSRGVGVRAENTEGGAADCILPISRLPDGSEQVWAMDYDLDYPRLCINRRFDMSVVHEDMFVALVYPAALRGVLEYTFLRHVDGKGCKWADDWKQFAAETLSCPFPAISGAAEYDAADVESVSDWIEDAVETFVANTGLVDKVIGGAR